MGCSNEFVEPDLGTGDLRDLKASGHLCSAEVDGDLVALILVAIHHGQGERARSSVAGGGGVEEREGAEVRHVMHAPLDRVLPLGREIVHRAVDIHVERRVEGVLCVEPQGMVDGLEEQSLLAREDGADGVDELGEVRELDRPALPDEAIEIGGHGESVGEIELLFHPAHAILVLPPAIPDIPFVEGDVNGMGDALGVAHPLEEGSTQAHRPLRLVG